MTGDHPSHRSRFPGGLPRARVGGSRRRTVLRATAGRVLAAGLAALLTGCGGGGSARIFLSIGTAGTGGIYYPLGGVIAALLSAADSTRSYTAEVTGGSVENVNRVAAGQIDLGFALGVTVYEAYRGGMDRDRPLDVLRVVAPLYPNMAHVLVRGGAGIASVTDLAGRRVSVGSPGSGTEQMARQILEAYGLGYDDLEVRFLTFNESAAALRDGALDAAILSVGYPASAVLEATTTGDATLIPLDSIHVEELSRRYPYYGRGVIPAGAYPGVDRSVPTVSMNNWIVSRADLDDEVVEALLNILRDQRVSLIRVHEMAKRIDLAELDRAPIPLHPAARRWLAR